MQDVADLLVQSEFVLALSLEAADVASRACLSLAHQKRLDFEGNGVTVVLFPFVEIMLEQPMCLHIANLIDDFSPAAISRVFVHAATPHVLITKSVGFCLGQSHALADLLPLEQILVEAFKEDLGKSIIVCVL